MSHIIPEPCLAPAPPKPKSLPTIWNVPDDLERARRPVGDDLRETMARVLAVYDPPPGMGRPRIDQRKALDGIIYRARTG